MSMQLIVFAIGIGLAALGALFGLWRWERGRRREALAQLDATQTELAIARDTLVVRTEEYNRVMAANRRIASQRERDEDTIRSAPVEDDGPMAPVLADTLERHRARHASNVNAGAAIAGGDFGGGGVSDGGGL